MDFVKDVIRVLVRHGKFKVLRNDASLGQIRVTAAVILARRGSMSDHYLGNCAPLRGRLTPRNGAGRVGV